MSNSLAIATVTATLQQQLQLAATKAVSGASVKIGCPKAVSASKEPEIDICLYQVTPNASYRNANLPYQSSSSVQLNKTQSALTLHYLFSFLGNDTKLEPQRLLGSVVSSLEAKPTLTKSLIKKAIEQPSMVFLKKSNLANQVERVKFTPASFSLEELSKLWSVFFHQIPYNLSVVYEASVVLIDGDEIVEPATQVQEQKVTTSVSATVPVSKAGGITLSDFSRIYNEVNAKIQITKAVDESTLTHYVLYWSKDGNTKLPGESPITQLFKMGKNLNYQLPYNTRIPSNAKYILVFTKNTAGEMAEGVSVLIPSVIVASGISNNLTIVNNKITGGSVTVIKAVDENDLTSYVLYWSQDGSSKLSGESALANLPKNKSLVYTPTVGTVLPPNAKYILVLTKNAKGETTTGVSTGLSIPVQPDAKRYTDRDNKVYTDRKDGQYTNKS